MHGIYSVQESDNQLVHQFFPPSKIRTDRESENIMNFLCLLTGMRSNATSIAQVSLLKVDASFANYFLIIVLLSIAAQPVFLNL